MNELRVSGWIYFKTNATTAVDAMNEFIEKYKDTELNVDNMREGIVLRDEEFEDIDSM